MCIKRGEICGQFVCKADWCICVELGRGEIMVSILRVCAWRERGQKLWPKCD